MSDMRPVPDHQEIWADTGVDQAVIFEIVVRVRLTAAWEAEFVDAVGLLPPLATGDNPQYIGHLPYGQVACRPFYKYASQGANQRTPRCVSCFCTSPGA